MCDQLSWLYRKEEEPVSPQHQQFPQHQVLRQYQRSHIQSQAQQAHNPPPIPYVASLLSSYQSNPPTYQIHATSNSLQSPPSPNATPTLDQEVIDFMQDTDRMDLMHRVLESDPTGFMEYHV